MGCGGSKPAGSHNELDLSNKQLSALPVGDLKASLTKINVADNQLTELPAEIATCTLLTSLDMSSNKLAELPEALGSCMALEELLCFNNKFTKLPDAVGSLPALTTINFFNNKIKKLPDALGKLGNLDEVNFAANKLMMVGDAPMAGWSKVKILSLYDNNIVRLGSLAPLVALAELRLYSNGLEDMPDLGQVGAKPHLTTLEINKCQIRSIGDDYFRATPSLTRLVLDGNQLSALPPSLGECAALKQLLVATNKLRGQPLPATATWPALETLFLHENPGVTELPGSLTGCGKLFRVNLTKLTALSPDAVGTAAALQKACVARQGGMYWAPSGDKAMGPHLGQ